MSTFVAHFILFMLETLITSKTRIRILVKFFTNVANNAHLRGLSDEMNESTNAIRKELNNLSEAGYLNKEAVQNKIVYKANLKNPFIPTLQKIVHQYIGLDRIVEMILERMGNVEKIVIIGDYAKGNDTGNIEVVIIGEVNKDYVKQLSVKLEQVIKRKVCFTFSINDISNGLMIYESNSI